MLITGSCLIQEDIKQLECDISLHAVDFKQTGALKTYKSFHTPCKATSNMCITRKILLGDNTTGNPFKFLIMRSNETYMYKTQGI